MKLPFCTVQLLVWGMHHLKRILQSSLLAVAARPVLNFVW